MHVSRAQVLNKSPMTISGISASLIQHCSYVGANGTRRIRDSRILASANDAVTLTKSSTANRTTSTCTRTAPPPRRFSRSRPPARPLLLLLWLLSRSVPDLR